MEIRNDKCLRCGKTAITSLCKDCLAVREFMADEGLKLRVEHAAVEYLREILVEVRNTSQA